MPRVRIKPGMTHRSGRCRGGDVIEVTEAELVSFGDKFELVDEDTPHKRIIAGVEQVMKGSGLTDDEVDATQGARELAARYDIKLSDVPGTGKDGRVLISDVSEAIERGNA